MQIIKITYKTLIHYKALLKIFKLTEVMQQRGDYQLIDLSKNVLTGEVMSHNINIRKSRVIKPGAEDYPQNTPHFLQKVLMSKNIMSDSNQGNLFSEKTAGNLSQRTSQDKIDNALKKEKSNWGACRNPSH